MELKELTDRDYGIIRTLSLYGQFSNNAGDEKT